MSEKDFCSNCSQDHDCKSNYEHMGKTKGPSVAWRVFWVFLFPIVVFIVSLCAFERFFADSIESKMALTVASFMISLGICFICVLAVSSAFKHIARKKDCSSFQGGRPLKPTEN